MKVGELFSRLATGELSNLSIGAEGKIHSEDYATLIHHTNAGLLELFSNLVLLEKEVLVEQVEHITNYHLKKVFAESSGSTQPFKYIKDMHCDSFKEDVIKVLSVFTSTGERVPLNDSDHSGSYFLPQPDVIQVPHPVDGLSMSVTFQARHPVLEYKTKPISAVLDQDINIPFYLESALLSFVAYKIYSHMNGPENTAKGQEHRATFETALQSILDKDTANQTVYTSHTKLEQRGFV